MPPKFSFETQGEMRAYDRGRQDALDELWAQIYDQLAEHNAFPDKNPQAFAAWGTKVLLPKIGKRRTGDDLFSKLMNQNPE